MSTLDAIPVYDYAVRYCMTRQSYAFTDGLELAEAHWAQLAESTRRDVIEATRQVQYRVDPVRYPTIAKAVREATS